MGVSGLRTSRLWTGGCGGPRQDRKGRGGDMKSGRRRDEEGT